MTSVGPVNPRNEEVSNAAECEALQEQGEKSADEHDPIVEFASEQDVETELRNSQNWLSLAQISNTIFFYFFSLLPHCSRQLRSNCC